MIACRHERDSGGRRVTGISGAHRSGSGNNLAADLRLDDLRADQADQPTAGEADQQPPGAEMKSTSEELRAVEQEISELYEKLKDARARRDALKKPPNLRYQKLLKEAEEKRRIAFRMFIKGATIAECGRVSGLGQNAKVGISKFWRQNFRAHHLAKSGHGLTPLRDSPPLGWEKA